MASKLQSYATLIAAVAATPRSPPRSNAPAAVTKAAPGPVVVAPNERPELVPSLDRRCGAKNREPRTSRTSTSAKTPRNARVSKNCVAVSFCAGKAEARENFAREETRPFAWKHAEG